MELEFTVAGRDKLRLLKHFLLLRKDIPVSLSYYNGEKQVLQISTMLSLV